MNVIFLIVMLKTQEIANSDTFLNRLLNQLKSTLILKICLKTILKI